MLTHRKNRQRPVPETKSYMTIAWKGAAVFLCLIKGGILNPTSTLSHPTNKNHENGPSRKLFSQHRLPGPPPNTAKDRISHAQENIIQNLYPDSIPHSGDGGTSHRLLIRWRQRAACRSGANESADSGSHSAANDSTRTANGHTRASSDAGARAD